MQAQCKIQCKKHEFMSVIVNLLFSLYNQKDENGQTSTMNNKRPDFREQSECQTSYTRDVNRSKREMFEWGLTSDREPWTSRYELQEFPLLFCIISTQDIEQEANSSATTKIFAKLLTSRATNFVNQSFKDQIVGSVKDQFLFYSKNETWRRRTFHIGASCVTLNLASH